MAFGLSAAGCAAARPPTFADRFIIPGTPAIDVGGGPATSRPVPAVGRPDTPRLPRTFSDLPTLESTSPTLRARLATLATQPSPEAYRAVAAAYHEFGVDDRGFDYLVRGLADFPRSAVLHDQTARQWRDWNLPDRALRHAHLAVRYAPESPAAHTTLGTVLWALAAHGAAVDAFSRAAELAPDADFARHNVCRAELELGRPTRPVCRAVTPAPGRWRR